MIDWKTQQKVIDDAQQYKLKPDLSIEKNTSKTAKTEPKIEFTKIVLCPFCLSSYEFQMFKLVKGLRECPKCTAHLKVTTLAKINGLNDLVHFVFNYRHSGFWSKICMDVEPKTNNTRFLAWNNRLYELRLSQAFWEQYKLLKGDNGEEEDYETF